MRILKFIIVSVVLFAVVVGAYLVVPGLIRGDTILVKWTDRAELNPYAHYLLTIPNPFRDQVPEEKAREHLGLGKSGYSLVDHCDRDGKVTIVYFLEGHEPVFSVKTVTLQKIDSAWSVSETNMVCK